MKFRLPPKRPPVVSRNSYALQLRLSPVLLVRMSSLKQKSPANQHPKSLGIEVVSCSTAQYAHIINKLALEYRAFLFLGIEIQPSLKHRMESNLDSGVYRMTVVSISTEDICEYTIRAENEYGVIEATSRLVLQHK